jgi:hypothetical protein
VRFATRCCGKETFATEIAAERRLNWILRNPKYTGPKKPKRVYQCANGYWHMTSQTFVPGMSTIQYTPRPPVPEPTAAQKKEMRRAYVTREVIRRDGRCIRCGRDPRIGEILVSMMRVSNAGTYTGAPPANERLSNFITVCTVCRDVLSANFMMANEWGWKLLARDDPQQFPVLYSGRWAYLDDEGGVVYAAEEEEMSLPELVIVDVDGSIAERDELQENCRGPFDWGRVGEDEPVWPIIKLVRLLMRDHLVLFVSGRMEEARYPTILWIDANVVPVHHPMVHGLLMRKDGDHRPDFEVKKEIYETKIAPYYEVAYVIDDRKQVVDMWRQLGLTVLDVAGHTY